MNLDTGSASRTFPSSISMRIATPPPEAAGLLAGTPAGGRPAEEQPPPIGKCKVPAHGLVGPVLRQIAFDEQLGPNRQRILRHAQPDELIRTAAFDHPVDDGAVGI